MQEHTTPQSHDSRMYTITINNSLNAIFKQSLLERVPYYYNIIQHINHSQDNTQNTNWSTDIQINHKKNDDYNEYKQQQQPLVSRYEGNHGIPADVSTSHLCNIAFVPPLPTTFANRAECEQIARDDIAACRLYFDFLRRPNIDTLLKSGILTKNATTTESPTLQMQQNSNAILPCKDVTTDERQTQNETNTFPSYKPYERVNRIISEIAAYTQDTELAIAIKLITISDFEPLPSLEYHIIQHELMSRTAALYNHFPAEYFPPPMPPLPHEQDPRKSKLPTITETDPNDTSCMDDDNAALPPLPPPLS